MVAATKLYCAGEGFIPCLNPPEADGLLCQLCRDEGRRVDPNRIRQALPGAPDQPAAYLEPAVNDDGAYDIVLGAHDTERLEVWSTDDNTVALFGHHGATPVEWTLDPQRARQLAASLTLAADQAEGLDA